MCVCVCVCVCESHLFKSAEKKFPGNPTVQEDVVLLGCMHTLLGHSDPDFCQPPLKFGSFKGFDHSQSQLFPANGRTFHWILDETFQTKYVHRQPSKTVKKKTDVFL